MRAGLADAVPKRILQQPLYGKAATEMYSIYYTSLWTCGMILSHAWQPQQNPLTGLWDLALKQDISSWTRSRAEA
jgi:hypothetical protein